VREKRERDRGRERERERMYTNMYTIICAINHLQHTSIANLTDTNFININTLFKYKHSCTIITGDRF